MDQAERLRTLMGTSDRRARVIAITSGKGGVGKTSLAVNLSIALAQRSRRVVLADFDIGLANADVLMGVQPRMHAGHVLNGEMAASDALTQVAGGVWLLPGAVGARHFSDLEKSERDYLCRSLAEIESSVDFLVLDTAAGISRNVIQFASHADEVIIVTTPEPTAVTDGYAILKAISREKGTGRLRIVVNFANDYAEAQRVFERIQSVARRFLGVEADLLGYIVTDDHVRQAVRRRRPFLLETQGSKASQCVRAIADRLLGEEPVASTAGFVKKFASSLGGVMG